MCACASVRASVCVRVCVSELICVVCVHALKGNLLVCLVGCLMSWTSNLVGFAESEKCLGVECFLLYNSSDGRVTAGSCCMVMFSSANLNLTMLLIHTAMLNM